MASLRPFPLFALTLLACSGTPPRLRPPTLANAACYWSPAGPLHFGSDINQEVGPSWLVLERYDLPEPVAPSGRAVVLGPGWDASHYSAIWQLAGDSIVVQVRGSLTVWEYRLRADSIVATGMALWTTDQLIFDSGKARHRVTERWAVWAQRKACDATRAAR